MRVTVLAVGSRGDVQPYVALGTGLREAGHDVRLATHAQFRALVEERGIECFELEGDPRALIEEELGQAWLESGSSPLAFWRNLAPLVDRFFERAVADRLAACRPVNAVVYSALGFTGYHAAERLGVPSLGAYLAPVNPTREFPSPLVPTRRRLRPTLNRLTHVAAEQMFWQIYRRPVNRWRAGGAPGRRPPPTPSAGADRGCPGGGDDRGGRRPRHARTGGGARTPDRGRGRHR